MPRNKDLEAAAKKAAQQIAKNLEIEDKPVAGIILGTGWEEGLSFLKNERSVPFNKIVGFNCSQSSVNGHKKVIVAGEYGNKTIIALKGRNHLNEDPGNPRIFRDVRLQTEMLIKLGITKIISTSAVGSLPNTSLEVGDILVVNGLITLYAPQMPLWAGEFTSPEDTLSKALQLKAFKVLKKSGRRKISGAHVMVLGPHFESRKYDKDILASDGASVVGMSLLPEAVVIGLYPKRALLGLCLVTNSATEVHSHETNILRAHKQKDNLQVFLKNLFSSL